MIDSTVVRAPTMPNIISVFNDESILRALTQYNATLGTLVSGNYPAANRIFYVPFHLKGHFYTGRLGWMNGNVVSGGANVQMGVCSQSGLLLCTTGSVAQATASVPQWAAPTVPLWLQPGRYYWALTLSATTNCRVECFSVTTLPNPHFRGAGFLMESADPGVFGLVAQATFATFTGTSVCPILAMQGEDLTFSY